MVTGYIFYHTSNILRLIQSNEIFLSNTIDVVCQLFDNLIFNILQTNQTSDSFINLYHTGFFVLWSKKHYDGGYFAPGGNGPTLPPLVTPVAAAGSVPLSADARS